ncbi:hypothetical protein [Enterococcus sp. AZ163]|uniref:hypothetical protein n=1 Tax=Enterococcus sp. AZ163 TaxID=2774638 RepID=UPI003D2BCA56
MYYQLMVVDGDEEFDVDSYNTKEEAEDCIAAAEGMYLGMDYAYVKASEDKNSREE